MTELITFVAVEHAMTRYQQPYLGQEAEQVAADMFDMLNVSTVMSQPDFVNSFCQVLFDRLDHQKGTALFYDRQAIAAYLAEGRQDCSREGCNGRAVDGDLCAGHLVKEIKLEIGEPL